MTDYLSNSNRMKEENDKRVEKVVTSQVITKKKSAFSNFISSFVPSDSGTMKEYILGDVVVPLIKKAISDVIDALLYPNGGSPRDRKSKVSYRSYYDDRRTNAPRRDYRRTRVEDDIIVIPTRGEAELVLDRMYDILREYGSVSVLDYNDLLGVSSSHTDNDWGWTDLGGTNIVRMRDNSGFELRLPRPVSIK